MKLKKLLPFLVLGLVAAFVLIGAFSIRSASAAAPFDEETFDSVSLKGDLGRGFDRFSKADLAAALGITEDELTAAIQVAREGAIDQGVEQGAITQSQADELKSGDSVSRLDRVLSSWLFKNGLDFESFLADALEITVDKLHAAYQQAFFTRIDQAVVDGKLSEEQALLAKARFSLRADAGFRSSIASAYEAAVLEAVKNGVITQEQADLILEKTLSGDIGSFRDSFNLFGLESMKMKPGHFDRGAFPRIDKAAPVTEP